MRQEHEVSLSRKDLRYRFRVHLASARPVTTHVVRSFSDEARVEKYVRAESGPSYQTPTRDNDPLPKSLRPPTTVRPNMCLLTSVQRAYWMGAGARAERHVMAGMDQQTRAVAEAIPSMAPRQPWTPSRLGDWQTAAGYLGNVGGL